MPKTRAQKEKDVKILSEKLGKAKSLVFTDYRGLTMKQLSDLRDKLNELEAEFTITKNTLLERALPTSQFSVPSSNLKGPTALLLAYDDEISPIKILAKIIKDSGFGKIKLGFLGKDLLDEETILKLALLPGKDELRAKTVGILNAPLQGIVGVLMGNLRNLIFALDQIKVSKGGV